MRTRIFLVLTVMAMVFAIVPVASANGDGPGLSPESVEAVVFPGGEYEVEKTVHTPELPPILDVCLIVDLSGSYWDDLPNIKSLAPGIWDDIVAGGVADLQMGLTTFIDFPHDPWGGAGDYAYRLDQQLTPDKLTWTTAIDAMVTNWGNDEPESQYEAFYQLATGAGNAIGEPEVPGSIEPGQGCDFRADATKVAIMTTDASFHNAGDPGVLGPYPGHSALDTTNALVDAEIVVIGLKAPGASGELDALAAATGGSVLPTSDDSSDIADAILDALQAIEIDVSMASDCAPPISTTFDPAVVTVEAGEPAVFTETIAVAADAPGGTYTCSDWALIDGEPMIDGSEDVIFETKTIKVPEGFLTGGGQIGKGKTAENFGGNVGFLADFSVVGQWQFRDGATKLNMHSLSIDTLQFFMIGGDPADPPTANANAAYFAGTAKVKDGAAKWIDTCTFEAWAEDHGEPEVADSFAIYIECGATNWYYEGYGLDAGNLQIHSGVKE